MFERIADFVLEYLVPILIVAGTILILVGLFWGVRQDIRNDQHAYAAYCQHTGTTNLTFDEFLVLSQKHLLKPLDER